MNLENELSGEDMQQIRANELSNIVIKAYNHANNQITFPKESNIKLKWTYAQINANKQSYLTYLNKYINGDKSIFTSLRNYLVAYCEAEIGEDNGNKQVKIYYEMQKTSLLKYVVISTALTSFFIPIIGIAAIGVSILYFKKISNLAKEYKKIDLDMAFKEAAIEELKEIKESDLELALNLSKNRFKK